VSCQEEALSGFRDKVEIIQASAIGETGLSDVKGVIISTELVDAFPTKIICRKGDEIEELYIDKGDQERFEEVWSSASGEARIYYDQYSPSMDEGEVYPLNTNSLKWMRSVANILSQGYVITVDYMPSRSKPIALKSRKLITSSDDETDYLRKSFLGNTDITAGVDFKLLLFSGKESGLKARSLSPNNLFLYALKYDELLHQARKNMIDDDTFELNGMRGSISYSESIASSRHWRVFMQSKNMIDDPKLLGSFG
jgi:SAM-dependent MidA family methyltransferase